MDKCVKIKMYYMFNKSNKRMAPSVLDDSDSWRLMSRSTIRFEASSLKWHIFLVRTKTRKFGGRALSNDKIKNI